MPCSPPSLVASSLVASCGVYQHDCDRTRIEESAEKGLLAVVSQLAESGSSPGVQKWTNSEDDVDVAVVVQQTIHAISQPGLVSPDNEEAMKLASVAALSDEGGTIGPGRYSQAAKFLDGKSAYLAALAVVSVVLRVVCGGAVSQAVCETDGVAKCRKATNGPSRVRCYAGTWIGVCLLPPLSSSSICGRKCQVCFSR